MQPVAGINPLPLERILRVGPNRPYPTVALAAQGARAGDIVEIDAGTYSDDVAVWPQNDLTIRAVGGQARMVSHGVTAESKAIWVIKGRNVVVENIAFVGARVPSQNGAGIRFEGEKLTVRGCLFEHNEMGLLTWNSPTAELEVDASEFRDNAIEHPFRPGDPVGHQIYVGTIRRFDLIRSYVHRGHFGHLVKSRARESHILYNRITDEKQGRASYELEFPNGGTAYVLGNIIQQSARSENRVMVSFGAEGYRWPQNDLFVGNNTLIDNLAGGGRFLRVAPGAGRIQTSNNLLMGRDTVDHSTFKRSDGNFKIIEADVAAVEAFDVRLVRNAMPLGRAIETRSSDGKWFGPDREYVHPMQSRPTTVPFPRNPGAMQTTAQ